MNSDRFGRFGGSPGSPGPANGQQQARPPTFSQPQKFAPPQTFRPAQNSPSQPKPMSKFGQQGQSNDSAVAAQWDSEMDQLDQQQEQLLNSQWTLIRKQVASMMGAISEVKADLNSIKSMGLTDQLAATVESMIEQHDGHDKNHSSYQARLDYIEKVLGESADKHGKHEAHKSSMDERMEWVEKVVGESADKHGKHEAHKSSMDQRMEWLEKVLGESADKHADHASHKASMEQRMQFLEKLQGDSADKHAGMLADLENAVGGCARSGDHQNITMKFEQRVLSIQEELSRGQQVFMNSVNMTIKDHYNSLLSQERMERNNICRCLEERVCCVEMAMNMESSMPMPYVTRQASVVMQPSMMSPRIVSRDVMAQPVQMLSGVPTMQAMGSPMGRQMSPERILSSVQPIGTMATTGLSRAQSNRSFLTEGLNSM